MPDRGDQSDWTEEDERIARQIFEERALKRANEKAAKETKTDGKQPKGSTAKGAGKASAKAGEAGRR